MLVRISHFLILALIALTAARAQDNPGRPGDFGYRHWEYHYNGLIDELRRKTGRSCCDGAGECRATFANMPERKVFLDGHWCPIGGAVVRYDLALPDDFALVCAGRSAGPTFPCPVVYCVAVATGS